MEHFVFYLGDGRDDVGGKVSWAGSINTADMTGVLVTGKGTGPYNGAVTRTGGVSGNATESTFEWAYDVTAADNSQLGDFFPLLRLTHSNNKQETVDIKLRIEVKGCG